MGFTGFKAVSALIFLLSIACSKEVSPPTGGNGPQEPIVLCNTSAECPSGKVCDFTFPSRGKAGQCLAICPADGNCPAGEVCSPISGACEPSCADSGGLCDKLDFSNSIRAVCIKPDGYCAIPSSGAGCPSNFKAANNFCKFASENRCLGTYKGVQLTSDPITQTCELQCSFNNDLCESQLSSLQIPGSNPVTYRCSRVTAVCAPQCAQSPDCSSNTLRKVCAINQGSANGGTCEVGCSSPGAACSDAPGLTCSKSSLQDGPFCLIKCFEPDYYCPQGTAGPSSTDRLKCVDGACK